MPRLGRVFLALNGALLDAGLDEMYVHALAARNLTETDFADWLLRPQLQMQMDDRERGAG